MTFSKRKLDGMRVLRENSKLHSELNGHEPYFTLTPAGAQALKEYLAKKEVSFSPGVAIVSEMILV